MTAVAPSASLRLSDAIAHMAQLPSELSLGDGVVCRLRLVAEGPNRGDPRAPLPKLLVGLVNGADCRFGKSSPDGTLAVQLPSRLPPTGGPRLLVYPVSPGAVLTGRADVGTRPDDLWRGNDGGLDLVPFVYGLLGLARRPEELTAAPHDVILPDDHRFVATQKLAEALAWAESTLGTPAVGELFAVPVAVKYPHRPTLLYPETFVHPMTANLALRGLDEKYRGDRRAFGYEIWQEFGHVLYFLAARQGAAARLGLRARLLVEEVLLQAGRGHWLGKTTTPLVALVEGWAAFVAQAVYAWTSDDNNSLTPVDVAAGPRGGPRGRADLASAGRGPKVEGAVASFLWRLYRREGAGAIREAFGLLAEEADIRQVIRRWVSEGRPFLSTATRLAAELGLQPASATERR